MSGKYKLKPGGPGGPCVSPETCAKTSHQDPAHVSTQGPGMPRSSTRIMTRPVHKNGSSKYLIGS